MDRVVEEYETLVSIAERTGGEAGSFGSEDVIYVVVHGNRILASHALPGVLIEAVETEDGIDAKITVQSGVAVPKPVHLCFGHLATTGRQVIKSRIFIEDKASADFQAHCIFPNAIEFLHAMEGEIHLGAHSAFSYREVHVHGPEGRIDVRPVSRVRIGEGAIYRGDFTLVEGRVGNLAIDIDVEAYGKRSRVEVTSKVYGKADDACQVRDIVRLTGPESSALIKARVVLKDKSQGKFLGLVDGAAAGARGHVDCTEVVQGEAKAVASPVVQASHPEAEVTHEAAIGRIADEKIQGLMAKGLSADDAIDFVVSGLLR
jgi:Fe-S cluster assembly scaffold protein SufB